MKKILLTLVFLILPVISFAGGARVCDGDANDEISVASNAAFDGNGTICFWMRSSGDAGVDGGSGGTSTEGTNHITSRADTTGSTDGVSIFMSASGDIFTNEKQSGGGSVCTASNSTPVGDDVWHWICYAFDQGTSNPSTLWVDGVEDATCTSSGAWSFGGQAIQICNSDDTFWEEYSGEIAWYHWYDTKLVIWQVQELMYKPCSLTDNLQLCLPIWGVDSPEVDLSGNGRTGTVTETTEFAGGPPVQVSGGGK